MTTTPSDKSSHNWTRTILVISLALNLLVVGVILGAKFSGNSDERQHGPQNLAIGVLGSALERDDRRALGSAFRKEMRAQRDDRPARVVASQFLEVLRAPEFAPDDLEALMRAQFAATSASFDVGRALLLERITEMTPEERAAYADRLEEGVKRKFKGKRKP